MGSFKVLAISIEILACQVHLKWKGGELTCLISRDYRLINAQTCNI